MKYLFILFLSALLFSCNDKKVEARKETPKVEVDKVWVVSEELSKINDSEMSNVFHEVGKFSTNIKSQGYDAFVFNMLSDESLRVFVYDMMNVINKGDDRGYGEFLSDLGLGPGLTDLPEGTLHKKNCKHVKHSKVPVKTMHAMSTIGYLFSYCKDCFPDTCYYSPSFHDDADWGHDESYRGRSESDINDVIRLIDYLLNKGTIMPNKEKVRQVYDDLSEFYDDLGTPEEFGEYMADRDTREKAYGLLKKHYNVKNDFRSFERALGYRTEYEYFHIMKLLLKDAKDNLELVEYDFPNDDD